MPLIRHRLHINASAANVYRSITEIDALKSWWTRHVEGRSRSGDILTFRFKSGNYCSMKITSCAPDRSLTWGCVDGADDWINTCVKFLITTSNGRVVLDFEHAGWQADNQMTPWYNFEWGRHLVSLRDYCEQGRGAPDCGP